MPDESALTVTWEGAGRKPRCPPNPRFPDGVDLDASKGVAPTCSTKLPYPAPEVGMHVVSCSLCGLKISVTAAGRRDDPRSLKLACRFAARA